MSDAFFTPTDPQPPAGEALYGPVEQALRESEAVLRSFYDSAPLMMGVVDVLENDILCISDNAASARFLGVDSGTTHNRLASELGVPREHIREWIGHYQECARANRPIRFEFVRKTAAGSRWLAATVALIAGLPTGRLRCSYVAEDITQRKQALFSQQFLSDLEAQVRPMTDADTILWTVVNALGAYMGVSCCGVAEIDAHADTVIIHRDFHRDTASMAGTYPLSGFVSPEFVAQMQAGRVAVVADVLDDLRTADRYASTYQPLNIRSFLSVPCMRDGQWMATLFVNSSTPRSWTQEEIALMENIVQRTWLSVENARLFEAERERSKQLAQAVQEVHHRVKNSLQSVMALLEMQILPDSGMLPADAVYDSLSQIKTIALVHDLLARDQPIGIVNAAQVLTNLAALLSEGMRSGQRLLTIQVDAEPVWLSTKAATALALAVNELITNATKHNECLEKKDTNSHDTIEVSLHEQDGNICVAVQDGGPGFPPNFDPVQYANLGLELVLALVENDLQGTIRFSNGSSDRTGLCGGRVEIVFCQRCLSE